MYDLQGHLIGEYTNTGALIQETVWLNDLPIATIRPNGTGISVYFVHADELGTPRVVTDTAQKPVWRWDGDAFGRGLPNQDPLKTGVKFVYHLRYPGQYYDTESGLHYNYFRDYDPETGRYIQSDPIGLAGGFNTYAYVEGNPLAYIDPEGLAPSISSIKKALEKVHNILGGPKPKGEPGKFGSPQRGDGKQGYRLDPPHPNRAPDDPESDWHINWWDYTDGKRGKGGRSGAERIIEGIFPLLYPPGFEEACETEYMFGCPPPKLPEC